MDVKCVTWWNCQCIVEVSKLRCPWSEGIPVSWQIWCWWLWLSQNRSAVNQHSYHNGWNSTSWSIKVQCIHYILLLSAWITLWFVLWTNPVLSSTAFAHPVSLLRAAEDRCSFHWTQTFVWKIILQVLLCEINVNVVCKTECSVIDGKMVPLLQGDIGAFCHLCGDANDIALISQGFKITKDYNSCKEAWEKLVAGQIGYSSSERKSSTRA